MNDFQKDVYVFMIITKGRCTNHIGCIHCEKNMKKVCGYKGYKWSDDVQKARVYFAVRRLKDTNNFDCLFEQVL